MTHVILLNGRKSIITLELKNPETLDTDYTVFTLCITVWSPLAYQAIYSCLLDKPAVILNPLLVWINQLNLELPQELRNKLVQLNQCDVLPNTYTSARSELKHAALYSVRPRTKPAIGVELFRVIAKGR
jgi:hypothetical protein